MEHMDDLRRNKKEFSDWDMTLHTCRLFQRKKWDERDTLTSIANALGWALTLALVRASGSPQCRATSHTNPLAGTRMPIVDDPGFRLGFNAAVLWNTTVTGPGSSSCSNLLLTVTCPQLQCKKKQIITMTGNTLIQVTHFSNHFLGKTVCYLVFLSFLPPLVLERNL